MSAGAIDLTALDRCKLWKVADQNENISWALLGTDAGVCNTVRVVIQAVGNTSLADVKGMLKDDQIQWLILKVHGVDTRGTVTSTRTKWCFFSWQGDNTSRSTKTHAREASRALSDLFTPHAVHSEVFDRDGLDEADIEKRLRACGGAHQPERMVFPGGDVSIEFSAGRQPSDGDLVGVGKPLTAKQPVADAAVAAPGGATVSETLAAEVDAATSSDTATGAAANSSGCPSVPIAANGWIHPGDSGSVAGGDQESASGKASCGNSPGSGSADGDKLLVETVTASLHVANSDDATPLSQQAAGPSESPVLLGAVLASGNIY